jgi:negative regulator of sigma E activity
MIEQDTLVVVDGKNSESRSTSVKAEPRAELLEVLSALMDNEAEELEVRRVVKSLQPHPELSETWRRYHAVRASLRQDIHAVPGVNLLAGIHAKLGSQGAVAPRAGWKWALGERFMRIAGQGVIAASVAGAVLLGSSLMQNAKTTSDEQSSVSLAQVAAQGDEPAVIQTESGKLPVFSGDYNNATPTRTVSLDADARSRLERAVRNYSGTSAVINVNTTPMFPTQFTPFRPGDSSQLSVDSNPSQHKTR